jgi:hypothetical protein
MYISVLFVSQVMGQTANNEVIVKDFNEDGITDTLLRGWVSRPKNILKNLTYIDGENSSKIIFELSETFGRLALYEYYDVYCSSPEDTGMIKKIAPYLFLREELPEEVYALNDTMLKCYLNLDYEVVENELFSLVFKAQSCFGYSDNLIDSQEIFTIKAKNNESDGSKGLNFELWHFWGHKLILNEFSEIKLNDTISFFEYYGCSFLKVNDRFTWVALDPRFFFWTKKIRRGFIPFKSKVLSKESFLIIKRRGRYGEYAMIFNYLNGKNIKLDVKDFKDFFMNSEGNLEVLKFYGENEVINFKNICEYIR